MPAIPVPDTNYGQNGIVYVTEVSPYTPAWWQAQVITDIPADSVGWLVAQSWQITAINYDNTTTPPTPYYTMARESLQNWIILQSLLDEYTYQRNVAMTNNTTRYNDVIVAFDGLIDTSHFYWDDQADTHNTHETAFIAILDGYMTIVDGLVSDSESTITQFDPDYSAHEQTSLAFLVNLGTTELARIIEQFAASLATQLQQLTDRGLYSSALIADITERNIRDRDEQIQLLNDRLMREKLDNEHKLYEQKASMRDRVLAGTSQIITIRMNQSNARLSAHQAKHTEVMQLMAHQLAERNELYQAIYAFVERRDDIPPSFEALTQIATSLGDAGGGWLVP